VGRALGELERAPNTGVREGPWRMGSWSKVASNGGMRVCVCEESHPQGGCHSFVAMLTTALPRASSCPPPASGLLRPRTARWLLAWLVLLSFFIDARTNLTIVLTASLTVYCGCWRSIQARAQSSNDAMRNDALAMRSAITGACMVLSLFLASNFLPAVIVDTLMAGYIGAIGVLVLTRTTTPHVSAFFPAHLRDTAFTAPPFKIPYVLDFTEEPLVATVPEIVLGVLSACFCTWYLSTKHWFANNILCIAFGLVGIEHLRTSVQTGGILLAGARHACMRWAACAWLPHTHTHTQECSSTSSVRSGGAATPCYICCSTVTRPPSWWGLRKL
jgi:hypothetical protein